MRCSGNDQYRTRPLRGRPLHARQDRSYDLQQEWFHSTTRLSLTVLKGKWLRLLSSTCQTRLYARFASIMIVRAMTYVSFLDGSKNYRQNLELV